jgi:hypothetical protein
MLLLHEDITGAQSAGAGPNYRTNDLWRYQISNGRWTHVSQVDDMEGIAVSPDGSVIAVEHYAYWIDFIDSATGRLLTGRLNGKNPAPGNRWAAFQRSRPGRHDSDIVIFDMQNSWTQYEIPAPGSQGTGLYSGAWLGQLALWEPVGAETPK